MLRLLSSIGLIVCTASFTMAGTVDDVITEVEKVQTEPGLRTALVGFCLIPIDGNPEDAVGFNIDRGLIPASTMKAVTTATAMEILGSDFRFKTELQLAGTLDDAGTLTGNVVIRGGGDPTLGMSQISKTFVKWKSALDEAGVKKVEGSIVGDESIFGTKLLPDSWQWNDIGNYYGAGACGLTFHTNLFYCSFRSSGKVGSEAGFIGTDPKLPGIQFINEMKVGSSGSGDQGYIYGVPYSNVFYLRGTVPANGSTFTIKGSLPDPAFFCSRAFTKYLDQSELPVSGEPTTHRLMSIEGKKLAARKMIFEQTSDSLGSIIRVTNQKSDNLKAECIHRMIGVEKKKSGTTLAAAKAIEDYWATKGIDMTGFFMGDGCGLSRSNTVTPRQMTLILYHAAKFEKVEEFGKFYDSLPIAGRTGTLRGIGGGSAAEGRVHAKSGTLDRIKCYSGYINARSGKRYAFTIFVNNYSGSLSGVKSKIVRVWSKMADL